MISSHIVSSSLKGCICILNIGASIYLGIPCTVTLTGIYKLLRVHIRVLMKMKYLEVQSKDLWEKNESG